MLCVLSTFLLNFFIQNVFYQQQVLLQSTLFDLKPKMLHDQLFMLLFSFTWVLLDHLELMVMDGKGCAPPSVQLLMNFVVKLLCSTGDCVLHSFLQIFSLSILGMLAHCVRQVSRSLAHCSFWGGVMHFGKGCPLYYSGWCSSCSKTTSILCRKDCWDRGCKVIV